jgi:hypothetical protein
MRVIIAKTMGSVFGKLDKRLDFFKLNAFFSRNTWFKTVLRIDIIIRTLFWTDIDLQRFLIFEWFFASMYEEFNDWRILKNSNQ